MSSKPFTVMTMRQGSPEWLQARCGIFTASRAGEVFAKTQKGDWTAKRKDYRTELVLEHTTGKPTPDKFQSRDMLNGIEREARAIRAYENIHGIVTRSVGFVLDNEAPIGCSPDGVIGDFDGLVQAKCPKASTHLETLRVHRLWLERDKHGGPMQVLPKEYQDQVRHELYVTGAAWCDYFSYHPDFPLTLQAVTIRVTREDAALEDYARDVRAFLDEVNAECEQIAGWAA